MELWEHPHEAHLLPLSHTTYSILRLSSQQNSDPCTKSDRNYFSILHHSKAPSLQPALVGATGMGNCSISHAY